MSSVRALLTRVARLEAARVTPKSPFEAAFGSLDAFADLAAERLDPIDGPMLVNAVRRWHRDQVWQGWRYH